MFTPAPDMIHEIFGHCLPLMTPEISQISQMIGQESLGASDQDIQEYSKIYWYTIEVGLSLENGKRKAFGGAVLSSIAELQNAMGEKATFKRFNAKNVKDDPTPFNDEGVQGLYFIADSLKNVKNEVKIFCEGVRETDSKIALEEDLKKEEKNINTINY